MPVFKYRAYDAQGHSLDGEIEQETKDAALTQLREKGLIVAEISAKRGDTMLPFKMGNRSVSLSDLEFLTSELAILLNSGVKVDKGLSIIDKAKSDGAISDVVHEILQNLKSGHTVSDSFNTKHQVFDSLYINLIEIGEKSGQLPEIFKGLARDLKFKRALRAKVMQALTYPFVIFFVCVLCILFVFNFIVPQMASIFSEGDELPIYTQFMIAFSEWLIAYQWWLLGFILVSGAWIYKKKDDSGFRTLMARYSLKIPIVASLIEQVERIRFSSAMALMLQSGLKVDVGIASASDNIKNPLIKNAMKAAYDKIKKGAPVSQSLGMTPLYPSFYVSLLEVGEESGDMATIFSEITERSRIEFESWTEKVTNLLEPVLILVMGGIVGSVVITMLLSVVSVNDISI
ncbi:MAG: type II secretion system F family protein [Aestuariibacter sp.]